MEKKHSQPTTKASRLPGEDHGQQISIVRKVVESLAPGVAGYYPDFAQLLSHYLLVGQGHPLKPSLRQSICQRIQQINQTEHGLEAESLMVTIEGMSATMHELQIQSLEELGLFAQASKDAFREFIDRVPADEQADVMSTPKEGCR